MSFRLNSLFRPWFFRFNSTQIPLTFPRVLFHHIRRNLITLLQSSFNIHSPQVSIPSFSLWIAWFIRISHSSIRLNSKWALHRASGITDERQQHVSICGWEVGWVDEKTKERAMALETERPVYWNCA
jgi:hypothetical protein